MDLLVVEDNDAVGRGIKRLARVVSLHAEWVATIEEALAALASARVNTVVLVDLHLELKSGFDFVTELRRRGDERPVILMSGLPSEWGVDELTRLGIAGYLVKPFSADQLVDAFRAAVGAVSTTP